MSDDLKLQVGVKILIENPEGQILVLRKNGAQYDTRNYWDIPGGRIDAGTDLFENLQRELREEIGFELTDNPELVGAQDIIRPQKGIHVVRLTYHTQVDAIDHLSLTGEHLEFAWRTVEELLADPDTDEVLVDCLERLQ